MKLSHLNDLGPDDVVKAEYLNEYLHTDLFEEGQTLNALALNAVLGAKVTKDGMTGREWAKAVDAYWKPIHPDACFHTVS